MASIQERDGRFTVKVRRKGYPLAVKTFTRKTDAVAWGRATEVAMEQGSWEDPRAAAAAAAAAVAQAAAEEAARVPMLADAADEFWKHYASRLRSADRLKYELRDLKATAFAVKALDEVTSRDFAEWRDALLTRLQPGAVNRKLIFASSLFNWALRERGWVTVNPLSLVRKPSSMDERSRVISEAEFVAVVEEARRGPARWLAPVLTILTRSAMRRSELWGLQRSDVDWTAATAHLAHTKNGTARDVPLCPQALTALKELDEQAAQRNDSRFLPVGNVNSVSIQFARVVARARARYAAECAASEAVPDPSFLANLRLHDLRHSAVTHWASTGALGLVELMAISGHKSPRMLARYTHLKASALAEKLARLAA